MRAEKFSGYEWLKLVDLPKPSVSDGKVLLRMTSAGVTPLDHTILSGQFPLAKAPLVLGNEGAGVVEDGGGTDFPVGSRVMFTGPYGVFEDGTYSEWLAVRKENLCLIPEKSFILFGQPQADAWNVIVSLLRSGAIKPIVAKTFSLAEAADALRYLVEGRPFGRVVLTI
jgi:NADPH:quinone reductase-like Zn-dependent oxidoreductase